MQTAIIILLIAVLLLQLINIGIAIKNQRKRKRMDERFLAALNRIDTATNGIAAQLRDLAEKVKNGGMSAEAENEVLAGLESAAAKLEGIGKPEEESGTSSENTGTEETPGA